MNLLSQTGPRFGSLHIAEYVDKPGIKPERTVRLLTDSYDDDGIYFHSGTGNQYHSVQVGKSPTVARLTKALESFQVEGFDRFKMAEGDAHQAHFTFPQNLLNRLKGKRLEMPDFSEYRVQAMSQFFRMYPNLKADLASAIQSMLRINDPKAETAVNMDHVQEVAMDALHHGEQTADDVGFYLGDKAPG